MDAFSPFHEWKFDPVRLKTINWVFDNLLKVTLFESHKIDKLEIGSKK